MARSDLTRRVLLAGLAAAPLVSSAQAQSDWPSRPVRVMVPYPPAGGADTTARIIYAKLSEDLGQPFAIENRGGAGGTIGEAVVAKADADGYTILHDATAFSVNASLYANLPFDYRTDFDPVFLAAQVANILVVTPSVPVTTVADVIAFAKASPDGIDMASSGNGTLQHLLLELFQRAAGIKINHIPYRGGGLAVTDVMAGQVKFYFANGSAVVGLIKAGKLKAIAHTGKGPLASLPDIPPLSDTLPGFEGYDWNGVFSSARHAGRNRAQAQCRPQRRADLAASERAVRRAQYRIPAQHPRRIRRLCRKPDAALEPHREGSEYQVGLKRPRK